MKQNYQNSLTWLKEESSFPLRLKELMNANNTTQEQLANAIGVSRQTVSLYLQSQAMPDIYRAQQIADFFKVDVGYLLSGQLSQKAYSFDQLRESCIQLRGKKFFEAVMALIILNDLGMEKAIEQIKELSYQDEYSILS